MKSPIILLFIILLPFSSCKKNNADPNLVLEFLFNGNVVDSGPHDLTATASGIVLTHDRNGEDKKAYYFGGNGYIEVANINQLNFDNDFTLSAWINMSVLKAKGSRIIDKAVGSSGEGFLLDTYTVDQSGNKARFFCGGNDIIYSDNTLAIDTWYFIVSTYKDGLGSIYVNGELTATHQSAVSNIKTSNTPLRIGFDTGVRIGKDFDDSFVGSIDDVRIYNKALGEAEIKQLYKI